MFRISRIQQLMHGLPRGSFERTVDRYEADKHTKGFGCWGLLVAQVFGQLSGSRSLRELESAYNAHSTHHYHLGTGPLRRTTLADAGARRNPAVFEETVRQLMGRVHRRARRQAGEGLLLLDSTSLTLAGRGFDDWASAHRTRHTQGLKLHLLYDAGCATPVLQAITAANVNDVSQAAGMPLKRGATYVFDKGYCDYAWWARFDEQEAKFVTRLKRNARIEVVGTRPLSEADSVTVLADELIRFNNPHPGGGRGKRNTATLRRVTVARPGHDSALVLVSNDLERTAGEIAACYKARWQIELFFKWIKQNLRIKRFYGRSENAVRLQILSALIAYLLVSLYHAATQADVSLLRVLGTLRVGLFQRPETEHALGQRRRRERLAHATTQALLFT